MADLFQSTTIPILEQVVGFAQARHTVLAANVANADTPGYVARDLSVDAFRTELRKAIAERNEPRPSQSLGEVSPLRSNRLAEVSKDPKSILLHDKSQVGLEEQASEMVKNRLEHNTALTIMVSQFRLLQTAISEKV